MRRENILGAVLYPLVSIFSLFPGPASGPGSFTENRLDPIIERIEPPESAFYAKKLDYHGIWIKAHTVVADAALQAARERLDMMLKATPSVRYNLAENGVELHIIGKNQVTSDLPEYRRLKGKPFDGKLTVDQRTRGLGGLRASCGEENLLKLPGDRYAGRDICVHEFAHTIRAFGLSEEVRRTIARQYRQSLDRGKWKTAYAATNDDEFFAELSMWYFGTHGDMGKMSPAPGLGREGLRRYDPEAFDLLDRIFTGRIVVPRVQFIVLEGEPADHEKNLRSLEGTQTTVVVFRNRTSDELHLYWLDYQGKRRSYGTVPPLGSQVQNTFATHAWLTTDHKGKVLSVHVAKPVPGKALITASPNQNP
jgi:hypothetical protein